MRLSAVSLLVCLCAALALAGCDSAAEKAQKHYLSGMELAQAGDIPRALIELRNAFTFDPAHPEARLAYAGLLRSNGNPGEAYAQYQRVIETAPDRVEARHALAELSLQIGDWPEAERHLVALQRLDPDDPGTALVAAALAYRKAVLSQDDAAAAQAAKVARATLLRDPANLVARHVVIDQTAKAGDPALLRAEIDAALAALPAERTFHVMRLRLLAEARDTAALGTALAAFVAQFPQDAAARRMMIAWYVDTGDLDQAEGFLRKLAAGPGAGIPDRMTVVEFLVQARSPEAARAELDRLIAAEPAVLAYRARRAALDFDLGKRPEGLTEMTALVAQAPRDTPELADLKVTLARMQAATGDVTASVATLDAVLAGAPDHVAALKLRASWLIDSDRPAEAITTLRRALARAPEDAEILMLMGDAHDRDGARDLAGETYARAVEASGRAPAESVFYARFLMRDGRLDSAAAVLGDALRLTPHEPALLAAMGEIRLAQKDFAAATAIAATLRGLGLARADADAEAIEAESLMLQDRADDTIAYLEDLAATGPDDLSAATRMVQMQIKAGKPDEARAFLDRALDRTPRAPGLRFLRAGLHVLDDEPAPAEAIYRDLLAADPAAEPPLRALYSLLQTTGRGAEAATLLDEAAAAAPRAPLPRLLQAAAAEAAGEVERAIGLYEGLYAADSGNLVLANNLASLLASHREDADSLARARVIAKRLRGSQVPAFQDTYGWIETRAGNPAEGLRHLEPAAAGLPRDALVQVHLGLTHLALGQKDEARRVLQAALGLAGDNPLPAFAKARAALATLTGP